MDTKVCKKCGLEKPVTDFKLQKSAGIKVPGRLCFPCVREKAKEYRNNDLDTYKEKAKESYKKFREKRLIQCKIYAQSNKDKVAVWSKKARNNRLQKFKEWKSTLKCTNCNENHIACLEFHHIDPSTKEKSISQLLYYPKKMEKELEKCIVLCSNCHKKLHYNKKF